MHSTRLSISDTVQLNINSYRLPGSGFALWNLLELHGQFYKLLLNSVSTFCVLS